MFRQGDLFDLFAAGKRLGINGFHIIRNNNAPESGVSKRLVPDGSHIFGLPEKRLKKTAAWISIFKQQFRSLGGILCEESKLLPDFAFCD